MDDDDRDKCDDLLLRDSDDSHGDGPHGDSRASMRRTQETPKRRLH